MAKAGVITDIIDIVKTQKQWEETLAGLQKVDASIESTAIKLKALYSDFGNVKGMADMKKATDDLTSAQKDAARETDQLTALTKKLADLESEQAKKIAAVKEQISQKTREIKLEVQLNDQLTGAYKALNAQLEIAKTKYKDLAAANKGSTQEAKDLLATITTLDGKIKQIDSSIGNHQRNVGNYSSALDKLQGAWVGVVAIWSTAITAGAGLITFFKESIQGAMEQERADRRLLSAMNGNIAATERMIRLKDQLIESTLFSEDEIQGAIIMGVELGKTELQARKLVETAMGLSRLNGTDLNTNMINLSATYDGQTGKLGKLADEVKGLTDDQYANGVAVDILNKKYGKLSSEGLATAEGAIIQQQKVWTEFKESVGQELIPFLVEKLSFFIVAYKTMKAVTTGEYTSNFVAETRVKIKSVQDETAAMIAQAKAGENTHKKTTDKIEKTKQEKDSIQKLDEQIAKLTTTLNNQVVAGDKHAQRTADQIYLLQKLKTKYEELKDVMIGGITPMYAKPTGTVTGTPEKISKVDNPTPDFKADIGGVGIDPELDRKAWAKKLDITRDFVSQIQNLVNSLYDGQIQKLDEEKQAIDERYQAEYDAAEGNSAKQKDIKKRQAKEDAEIDKQKRKMIHDQAVINKAMAAMNIIINTAVGAMAQYEAGPGGFVLSALVIALGAISLATTLAQPIPALRHGRSGGPATIARVSEEGREGMVHNGKMYLTPAQESLMYIPEGASVIPHRELIDMAGHATMSGRYGSQPVIDMNFMRLEEKTDMTNLFLKQIRDKKSVSINITEKGIQKVSHDRLVFEEYLNHNIRFAD